MTSTNRNIGLADGRSSSRVLKPPGGGHSQVFGDCNEIENSRKNVKSFIENAGEKNEVIKHPINIKQTHGDNAVVPNLPVEEKKTVEPRHVRVPPGGFSSGLW